MDTSRRPMEAGRLTNDTACASCGRPNPEGARYCNACGRDLVQADEHAERRSVTVLFADAQDSTALTERIGDEEAYRLVQGAVACMVDAVERHGGTVPQFRGDGVMALFGAPVAREDAAVAAVTAALDMQTTLAALSDELVERLGVGSRFRIGMHTGPVVVGRVADRILMDVTAIGNTANVAARLEAAAEPGGVWLSEATWRLVRDFVRCERVGALDVRGVSEGVVVYRAVGTTGVRTRFEAALSRGLAPLVGRRRELALLEDLVARLDRGAGHVVLLTGEPGMGKSRVVLELHGRVGDAVTWAWGRCSEAETNKPWAPVAAVVRDLLGLADDAPPAKVAAAVDAAARTWPPASRGAAPALAWLLGGVDASMVDRDPRVRRAAVTEAVQTAVAEAARQAPVVVAVEDVHWADEASVEVIDALADLAGDLPVLVVVTARPGFDEGRLTRPWATRLVVDRLDDEQAVDLASAVLGASALSPSLRDLLLARTEGTPLFIEETAAALLEQGAVQRIGEQYELAVDPATVAVPTSIHDVVLTRVDRLAPAARTTLQVAAVIGREYTARLLDRVVDGAGRVEDHLAALRRAELVRERSHWPEPTFVVKHALIRDIVYATLLDDRRRALHRVVAEAIEAFAARVDDVAGELARHWLEAGDERRALGHLQVAAEQAMAAFSVDDAVGLYRLGIEVAERLDDAARLSALAEGLGMATTATGDLDEAGRRFGQAAAAGRAAGDDDAFVRNLAWQGYCELFLHRFDEAEATFAEAADVPHVGADARLQLLAMWRTLHEVLDQRDRIPAVEEEAATLLDGAGLRAWASWQGIAEIRANWEARWDGTGALLVRVDELPDLVDRAAALWQTGLVAAGRGDYATALALFHRELAMAERFGEVLFRARTLNSIGWVHYDLGTLDEAQAWNERCLDFVAEHGLPDTEIVCNARINLADVHLAAGRLDDAERELATVEPVVRRPTAPGDDWMRWRYAQHWLHTAGEAALARGHATGALALADECVAEARRTDSPKNAVKGLRLRAQARLARGDVEQAGAAAAEAVAQAERVGNPPQHWRSLLVLADAYAALGDTAAAQATAKTAAAVVDAVVATLPDEHLRQALRRSRDVQAIAARL